MAPLFLSLDRSEQRIIIESIIFAASTEENLTLENLRYLLLSDNSRSSKPKIKRSPKSYPVINEYLHSIINDKDTDEVLEIENEYLEKISLEEIEILIKEINEELGETNRPYRIVRYANCYQFATLEQYGGLIEKMLSSKTKKRFTSAQLETLAIIAYKQPVTKPEIDRIRNVISSNEIINALIEKDLITIIGRKEVLGRPLLYSTTNEFLRTFGLNYLSDLPKLTEIEEIAEQKLRQSEEQDQIVLNILPDEIEDEEIRDTINEFMVN